MARKKNLVVPEITAPPEPVPGTFNPHTSTHVVCNQFGLPYCTEISKLQDPEKFEYGTLYYGTEDECETHLQYLRKKRVDELQAAGARRIQQLASPLE